MTPIPALPAVRAVVERVVWFRPPAEALADPAHVLAHVMTFGTPRDLRALEGIVGVAAFRKALEQALPGVFDARSWAYWHLKCGRSPAPPLPVRRGAEAAPFAW